MGRICVVPWPPAIGPAVWSVDGVFSGKEIREIRWNESTGYLYGFAQTGEIYRRDGANNWTLAATIPNFNLYGGAYPTTAYWAGDIYVWGGVSPSNNACIVKFGGDESLTTQWSNYYWRFSGFFKGIGTGATLMTPSVLNYDTTKTGQRLASGVWQNSFAATDAYNTIHYSHEDPFGNYYVVGGATGKMHDYDISGGNVYTMAAEATNDQGAHQLANWGGKIYMPNPGTTPHIYSLSTVGGAWSNFGMPSGMAKPWAVHGAGARLYVYGYYTTVAPPYTPVGIAAWDGSAWKQEYLTAKAYDSSCVYGHFAHDASAPYFCMLDTIYRRSRL